MFLSDRFSIVLMKETRRLATEYEAKNGRRESLRKEFEVALWTIGACSSQGKNKDCLEVLRVQFSFDPLPFLVAPN